MPKIIEKKPASVDVFSNEMINQFRNELIEAGDFNTLMLQKGALKRKGGRMFVVEYLELNEYKEVFLKGVYAPLKNHLSPIPLTLWEKLYSAYIESVC